MTIHGREIKCRFTVGASEDVARLCPGGDIGKLADVLTQSNFADMMAAMRQLIYILAKAEDEAAKYERPESQPQNLTLEELRTISPDELQNLTKEAMSVIHKDQHVSVEVEPEKK